MKESQRTRVVAIMVLALVFSTGAVVSAITVDSPISLQTRTSTGVSIGLSLDQLDLAEEQVSEINALFASKQPQVDSVIGSAVREVLVVLNSVDADIRDVLTPLQLDAYERLRQDAPGMTAVTRTLTIGGGEERVDTIR